MQCTMALAPEGDGGAAAARLALVRCPFLAKVAAQNGEEYATSIALDPTRAVGATRPTAEPTAALAASWDLFHGPCGIVPLFGNQNSTQSQSQPRVCPFVAATAASSVVHDRPQKTGPPVAHAALPLASIGISIGSGGMFGDFLRRRQQGAGGRQPRRPQQGPGQQGSSSRSSGARGPGSAGSLGGSGSGSSGAGAVGGPAPQQPHHAGGSSSSSGPTGGSSGGPGRLQGRPLGGDAGCAGGVNGPGSRHTTRGMMSGAGRGPLPPAASASPTAGAAPGGAPGGPRTTSPGAGGGVRGTGAGAGTHRGGAPPGPGPAARSGAAATPAATGSCPLRSWLGPMAGLVFNQYDQLVCPPPIAAARAALARTHAVRQLRPQQLPVKLLAVAAASAAANLPCGAVREHFEKFSLGWVVAVHATIPFVAALRKAVVLPRFALLVTIASAVAGQAVGAAMERARLAAAAQAASAGEHGQSQGRTLLPGAAASHNGQSQGNRQRGGADNQDDAWRAKMVAGVAAGLASPSAADGCCARERDMMRSDGSAAAVADGALGAAAAAASTIVGLGSLLPQLPVVRVA